MSVYAYALDRVSKGAKFNIDLVEKTLKIDGTKIELKRKKLIREGELQRLWMCFDNLSPWETVEYLYQLYKRSVPSAQHNGNKSYFKADSVEDLTDDEIAFNMSRNEAQFALEAYVLLAGLSGWLKIENEKHFFWQSKVFSECVVLREWI